MLALLLLLAAPHPGGTLVVRLDQEPPSLDKLTDSALAIDWLLERKVLESMAALGDHPDYALKPALATDWSGSKDGLTFTFHLRRGVTWHDGAPFSCQDVVATVRKILDPNVRAMHLRNNFVDLDDIRCADDFTLIARYKRPYFLAFRALATLVIYPAHLLLKAGDVLHSGLHRAPVGTGPFKFEEWKTGDHISFVRNESYWGRKAYLDRVVYRVVLDPASPLRVQADGEDAGFTPCAFEAVPDALDVVVLSDTPPGFLGEPDGARDPAQQSVRALLARLLVEGRRSKV